MKFSVNTLHSTIQRYDSADDIAPTGIEELIEKIGAQLGAVDEVTSLGDKYQAVMVVKVVSCEKHPNADKLKVCLIDDGGVFKDVARNEQQLIQVVCGAPNVQAGMLAAWVPPGATVPSTYDKEPFVLDARDIRGQVSNGMLASPKELGLGDSHAGILQIDDQSVQPGTLFSKAYGLNKDYLIEIENKMFTHRPDLFGFLGVARELAGIQGLAFKSPEWYGLNPTFPAVETEELKLEIKNEIPELVPRFVAITMRDVQVGPSPVWLQVELAKIGIKSINNLVDYSNWYMLETGQPIHIYDYDKVKDQSAGDAATIVVRHPRLGEKIKLLNGKEIEPRAEAMMVATDQKLICVGGAMGGSDTEVDSNTTNIIIEAASWDMYEMRRTSMAHGLFTDAVTRFTKGQSPLQNVAVLAKIANQIGQHAGGKIAGSLIDDNHLDAAMVKRGSVHPAVTVTTSFINERLGLQLTTADMKTLLENVEFKIDAQDDQLTVTAPFWRTDIELREDVVEEIGRLYGYHKLPLILPKRDLTPATKDPMFEVKAKIRAALSKAGANEVLSYSFVPASLLDKTGQDKTKAFQVANALSPDLQYYRLSLMPSLLEKVHPNIKAGYHEFALFELGKTHGLDQGNDTDGVPIEYEFTALVIAANDKLAKPGAAYYQARTYLTALARGGDLVFKPVGEAMRDYPVIQPYDLDRAALVSLNGTFLGVIGEFKSSVARDLKLPKYAAGFEIDTTVLGPLLAGGPPYTPMSRFPKLTQDITLTVAASLSYKTLYDFASEQLDQLRPEDAIASLQPLDIYQKAADSKNISLRLTITSYDRTLTDAEVQTLLDGIATAAKNTFIAEPI